MNKTLKRLLWQRTLDRTVLRQPLPQAMPLERQQRDIGQQTKAFLDAIGRAIAEMRRPRALGFDMAAGKDVTCVAIGTLKVGEPPLLLEVRQRRYEWKVLEPARGGPASLQSLIEDIKRVRHSTQTCAGIEDFLRRLGGSDSDGEGDSCD